MRSGYDDHHHRSISTPDHRFHQKTIYLPMFCRLSLKDVVKLNSNHSHRDPKTSGEPSSPKVSCIGQVKRNNRVVAFPTTTAAKLKNVRPNAAGRRSGSRENMIMRVSSSSNSRPRQRSKTDHCCDINKYSDRDNSGSSVVVDIGEMDPPLPVVKKMAPPGDEVNIWKRRFNGVAELRSLRIEQVQLPARKFQPPPTPHYHD